MVLNATVSLIWGRVLDRNRVERLESGVRDVYMVQSGLDEKIERLVTLVRVRGSELRLCLSTSQGNTGRIVRQRCFTRRCQNCAVKQWPTCM